MNKINLSMQYKSKIKEVQTLISNIKNSGFNTGKYERELSEIINSMDSGKESEYKDYSSKLRTFASEEYASIINRLDKLIESLYAFDDYFKIVNFCDWLEIKLQDKNISNDDLESYVSGMINNLSEILEIDPIDDENEEYIFQKLYNLAYRLIELELVYTNESRIYFYTENSEIHSAFFSDLIAEKIGKLDTEAEDSIALKEKIYELRKNGIASNYYDLGIIKLLLSSSSSEWIKEIANSVIDQANKKLQESNDSLDDAVGSVEKLERTKNNRKDCYSQKLIDIRKKTIPFVITLSILVGTGYGIERGIRNYNTKDKYTKRTEIYSSIDDLTNVSTIDSFEKNTGEEVTVKVYGPWENASQRHYKLYDVSHIHLDTAKEYYEYGVENYGVVSEDGIVYSRYNAISTYEDSYTEVTKTTYENVGEDFNKGGYALGLTCSYLGYLFLLFIIELCSSEGFENYGLFWTNLNVNELIRTIKSAIAEKNEYGEITQQLKKGIHKLLIEINKNESCRRKFEEMYETNKYLLDNPEELYERISNLSDLDRVTKAKKLVRESK